MPHAHPSGFPRDGSRTVFYRSAGACPPRLLECADDGEGQALALRKGAAFFHRSAGPVTATLREL